MWEQIAERAVGRFVHAPPKGSPTKKSPPSRQLLNKVGTNFAVGGNRGERFMKLRLVDIGLHHFILAAESMPAVAQAPPDNNRPRRPSWPRR